MIGEGNMNINEIIAEKKEQLYKWYGLSLSTIDDICSEKTPIEKCDARTVYLLSKELGYSMEELVLLGKALPQERNNEGEEDFERNLPLGILLSIGAVKIAWEIIDSEKRYMYWDIAWCDLNADINSAEVDGLITSEQASYLRKKYLRM